MSRLLRDYQQVTLDVGPAHMRGRVVATDKASTTVRLDRPMTSLVPPRPHAACLHAASHPHPLMLDGVAIDDGPGRLRLLMGDQIAWRDRRTRPRLVLPLHATIWSDSIAHETETIDISSGGVLLPATFAGPVTVEIAVPGPAESVLVRAEGQALTRGTRTAVRFTDIAPKDAAVVEKLVMGVRTAIAERFATQQRAAQQRSAS